MNSKILKNQYLLVSLRCDDLLVEVKLVGREIPFSLSFVRVCLLFWGGHCDQAWEILRCSANKFDMIFEYLLYNSYAAQHINTDSALHVSNWQYVGFIAGSTGSVGI